jgi:hypothetical protein
MEEIMLNLSEFSLNHHPFGVKMVAKISDVEFRFDKLEKEKPDGKIID